MSTPQTTNTRFRDLPPLEKLIVSKAIEALANKDFSLINKIFPNGIAFRPKEGRIVIIEAGNLLWGFILTQKGFCFLTDLLPADFSWRNESDKWWVISNPQNKEEVLDIISMLKKFGKNAPRIDKKTEKLLIASKPEKTGLSDNERDVLDEMGIIFFQDATTQKKIGFRPIIFNQYIDGKIRHRGSIINNQLHGEESPYYVASYYPYGFEITDQEDASLVPINMQIVALGRVINPHIAHVKAGDPFNTFNTIVTSIAAKVIRKSQVYTVVEIDPLNPDAKPVLKEDKDVLEKISAAILKELHAEKNFFGFAIKSVEIVQVSLGGANAKALEEAATNIWKKQQQAIEAEGRKKVSKVDAEALKQSLAIKQEATAEFLRKIKDAGATPDIYILREELAMAITKILKP